MQATVVNHVRKFPKTNFSQKSLYKLCKIHVIIYYMTLLWSLRNK